MEVSLIALYTAEIGCNRAGITRIRNKDSDGRWACIWQNTATTRLKLVRNIII